MGLSRRAYPCALGRVRRRHDNRAKLWSLETALRVHLVGAPIFAFLVSAVHVWLAPDFNPALRAAFMTGLVIVLDAVVVAPIFERSYDMFRSAIATWIPFALIFIASLAAGMALPA